MINTLANQKTALSQQIDKKLTKQVRIDAGLCQLLKVRAAEAGMTIKTLLEGYLAELLAVENTEKTKDRQTPDT